MRFHDNTQATQATSAIPVVIEFMRGSRIFQVAGEASPLPILHNGPPGTFVLFENGKRVSLPTDQLVFEDDSAGLARIGLGGMSFEGMEGENLVFWRVRDLWPEERLSPERGEKMLLAPDMVSRVIVQGTQVWPRL